MWSRRRTVSFSKYLGCKVGDVLTLFLGFQVPKRLPTRSPLSRSRRPRSQSLPPSACENSKSRERVLARASDFGNRRMLRMLRLKKGLVPRWTHCLSEKMTSVRGRCRAERCEEHGVPGPVLHHSGSTTEW